MVRCQNGARAGPFGGVVPVQMAAGAEQGNATAAAASGQANNRAAARLGRSVKFARRAVKDVIDIVEDLADPDILAEFLEDEKAKH